MAYSSETINRRVENLRADAVRAARAMVTHNERLNKAAENLEKALADLEMFAANRKAERTNAEKVFDEKLQNIVNDPEGLDFDVLAELVGANRTPTTADTTADGETPAPRKRRGKASADEATETTEAETPAEG